MLVRFLSYIFYFLAEKVQLEILLIFQKKVFEVWDKKNVVVKAFQGVGFE